MGSEEPNGIPCGKYECKHGCGCGYDPAATDAQREALEKYITVVDDGKKKHNSFEATLSIKGNRSAELQALGWGADRDEAIRECLWEIEPIRSALAAPVEAYKKTLVEELEKMREQTPTGINVATDGRRGGIYCSLCPTSRLLRE